MTTNALFMCSLLAAAILAATMFGSRTVSVGGTAPMDADNFAELYTAPEGDEIEEGDGGEEDADGEAPPMDVDAMGDEADQGGEAPAGDTIEAFEGAEFCPAEDA
jgi:hypothetical protein